MLYLFRLAAVLILFGLISSVGQGQEIQEDPPAKTDAQETEQDADQRRFNEADANSDGAISRDEFQKYVESKIPDFPAFDKLMAALDKNQDDAISPSEFADRQAAAQQALAQHQAEMAAKQQTMEFADRFNQRFLGQDPKMGTEIKDLVAFDEEGNELDFADLRGKYTVINFGCLT